MKAIFKRGPADGHECEIVKALPQYTIRMTGVIKIAAVTAEEIALEQEGVVLLKTVDVDSLYKLFDHDTRQNISVYVWTGCYA